MKRIVIVFALLIFWVSIKAQDYSFDRKLGEESAKQVEMMIGLYPDSSLNAFVDEVGARLVRALGDSPFRFEFHVADMAEPNAFALPGGFIYVSRGLLALVNEEDELAGVLGHEMIHVTKRHSVKQMKKRILPSILMLPGAIVGGLVNEELGNIINTPISLGSELFLMNYSRKQEKEADLYGVELASEAGYDPSKLAVILNYLSKEMENMTGEAEQKSYFSSHPYTPKRVDNLDEHAGSIVWQSSPPIAENRSALYERLDGMHIGPNPAQGIFKDDQFMHPDLNLSVQFPDNWEKVNVPIAVGALEKEGNAQIILTLEENYNTVDSAANAFVKKYKKKTGVEPYKNKAVEINGLKARRVAIKENLDGNTIILNAYWIKKDPFLLNLVGVSLADYEKAIITTASSLRSLTDDEKQSITGKKLRMAKANKGESLKSFCERTGNVWDTKQTAIINGIANDKILEKDQVLKITIETPYF